MTWVSWVYIGMGRRLYEQLKKPLKSVPTGEWVDVWSGFWTSFSEKTTLVCKSRRGQANVWEDAVIDEEWNGSIVEHVTV